VLASLTWHHYLFTGVRDADFDPLAQDLAFELGKHREQTRQGSSGRCRQIQSFREGNKADSQFS